MEFLKLETTNPPPDQQGNYHGRSETQLPESWSKYHADDLDSPYYHNEETGESLWTPPPGAYGGSTGRSEHDVSTVISAASSISISAEDDSSTEKSPGHHRKLSAAVYKAAEASAMKRENTHHSRKSTQLPTNWNKYTDDESGNRYYHNTVVGTVQWVPPEGSTGGTADLYLQNRRKKKSDRADVSEAPENIRSSHLKHHHKRKSTQLPPNWFKYDDEKSGDRYYHNSTTDEVQWAPPEGSSGGRADYYLDKRFTIRNSQVIEEPSGYEDSSASTTMMSAQAKNNGERILEKAPSTSLKMAGPPLGPDGQLMPLPQYMDDTVAKIDRLKKSVPELKPKRQLFSGIPNIIQGMLLKCTDTMLPPAKMFRAKYWELKFVVLLKNGDIEVYDSVDKAKKGARPCGSIRGIQGAARSNVEVLVSEYVGKLPPSSSKLKGWLFGGSKKDLEGKHYLLELRQGIQRLMTFAAPTRQERDAWASAIVKCLKL